MALAVRFTHIFPERQDDFLLRDWANLDVSRAKYMVSRLMLHLYFYCIAMQHDLSLPKPF